MGVPITIKDALPAAGVRITAGSIHFKDHIAREDAQAVRQLKEAGAIILGKTKGRIPTGGHIPPAPELI